MTADLLAHWPMWASLAAVGVTIVFYMLDRWSMELVSISVIAALLLLFSLPGATAFDGSEVSVAVLLAGFANPALITIMALLVVGQGLFQTGALEGPTKALVRSYDRRPALTLLGAFLAVFFISAFTNNTPVVIMFLPIMSAIAARMGASTSRLMMPLSFVSIFAGMTTLIGTSTNLLAADAYERLTTEQLGFFDQTAFGLMLAGVGMVYLLIASRILLPNREDFTETMMKSGKQFVAQFEVTPGHFLDGKEAIAGMFPDLKDMTVRMIQRGERALLPPYDEVRLLPGDLVIVAATRQALTDLLSDKPAMLEDIWQTGVPETDDTGESQLGLVEAVIAPGSRMAGRTVEMLGFRRLPRGHARYSAPQPDDPNQARRDPAGGWRYTAAVWADQCVSRFAHQPRSHFARMVTKRIPHNDAGPGRSPDHDRYGGCSCNRRRLHYACFDCCRHANDPAAMLEPQTGRTLTGLADLSRDCRSPGDGRRPGKHRRGRDARAIGCALGLAIWNAGRLVSHLPRGCDPDQYFEQCGHSGFVYANRDFGRRANRI